MKGGGEAAGYDKDRRTTRVVRAGAGTGEREGDNCHTHAGQGDHQGQVKTAAVGASYGVGRLVALLRSPEV